MLVTPLHSEEIKAKLRMQFGSVTAFEESKRLPTRSVTDVLRGRPVRRTAEAIAEALGIPLQAVHSRYEDEQSTNGDSASGDVAHRLNEEVA